MIKTVNLSRHEFLIVWMWLTLCGINQLLPFVLPIVPSGLGSLLGYLNRAYGNLPIYVQENGMSFLTTINLQASVLQPGHDHKTYKHLCYN